MATQLGELVFKITGDNSSAKKAFEDTESTANKTAGGISSSLKRVAAAVVAGFAVGKIYEWGKALVKASSDAAETQQKFDVVFAGIRDAADKTALTFASSFGLSKRAAEEYLSTTGNLLQSIGMTEQASLDMSVALNSVAADLVSFTNYSGGMEGAANAVQSALLGEREALKGLGIALSDNDLKQYAESQGLVYASLTKSQQATLTLSLIQERAGNAVGDYARSSDSFANTLRRVNGSIENAAVKAGDMLVPSVRDLVSAFGTAVEPGGIFAGALDTIAEAGAQTTGILSVLLSKLNEASRASATVTDKKELEINRLMLASIEDQIKAQGGLNAVKAKAKKDSGSAQLVKEYEDYTQRINALEAELRDFDAKDKEARRKQTLEAAEGYQERIQEARRRIAESQKLLADNPGITEMGKQAIDQTIAQNQKDIELYSKKLADMLRREQTSIADAYKGQTPTTEKHTVKGAPATTGGTSAGKKTDGDIKKPSIELDAYSRQVYAVYSAFDQLEGKAAEAWDALTPQDKMIAGINAASSAIGFMSQGLSSLGNLSNAIYASMIEDVERERDAALEAAGVKEDTAVETAQKEYDAAVASGNAQTIEEKKKALTRAKINEEYDKKKKKLEYESAMMSWQIQLAMSVAHTAQAALNAYASTAAIPVIGPGLAPAAAIAAAGFGAIEIAAVAAAKPKPPAYETGGIVPGDSYTGDKQLARVNSGEMILNQSQQANLFKAANTTGGGGVTFAQLPPISETALFDRIYKASQDGLLFIADRAVLA